MKWDKYHQLVKKRKATADNLRQVVGGDFEFWANFHKANDADKLFDLCDALVVDLRYSEQFDYEQEKMFVMAFKVLKDKIKECHDVRKVEFDRQSSPQATDDYEARNKVREMI